MTPDFSNSSPSNTTSARFAARHIACTCTTSCTGHTVEMMFAPTLFASVVAATKEFTAEIEKLCSAISAFNGLMSLNTCDDD